MLFLARYVLPISSPHIENGGVLVQDDKIVDVGQASEMKVRYPTEPVTDFGMAVIMPGFVDAHTHLEYAALGGIVRDLPYAQYKVQLAEKERLFTSQDWDDSALLGGLDAVAAGVTTIADITRTGASGHAAQAIGLRGIVYREVGTMERDRVDRAVRGAQADVEAWSATVDDRITIGYAPFALYTCHPQVFTKIAELTEDGTPVACHLAGSREEYDFVKRGSSAFSVHNTEQGVGYGIDMPPWLPTGVSPVRYLLNWQILKVPNFLAIHCVHLDDEDIDILAEHDVAVAHCPRANAKQGMGVAPLHRLLRAGVRVGLGTDSPAACGAIDFFSDLRTGLMLQRAVGDKRDFISAEQMVYMATLGAARALRLDDQIGSLEKGKKADIVAVDLSLSSQVPTHYPNDALLHSCNRRNILMTMVDGKVLYDGELRCAVDSARVLARVGEMRQKLRD
ncbi:MAG: amidohydrolase family protein [Actinomycetota bacterium]|nr:amidohydrolase family protein [Actinomycetota bacterium]